MKKKTQTKRSSVSPTEASSKTMRIASDTRKLLLKDRTTAISRDISAQYASIMAYYYNSEAAEIESIVSALKARKDARC